MPGFSDRLRSLRVNFGLSQQKLADSIGNVSKSSINMYERGEREPSLETMEAFADFFNVDLDYLYGKSDVPNRSQTAAVSGEEKQPAGAGELSDLAMQIARLVDRLPPEARQLLLVQVQALAQATPDPAAAEEFPES